MDLQPGSRIGPYEILGLLGQGGMGQVYRVRDERLGREVALKLLPAALAEDPDHGRRLLQEAKAAGRLDHPNIMAVHDVGTFGNQPYMVTELLVGRSLGDLLETGPLPVRRALALALQLAHGLAAAHEKGILHRDIKPENLFITQDNRLKILDFGLAKQDAALLTGAQGEGGLVETFAGVVMGTVGYMAPEQIQGNPVDNRSDIFAFGVVLYEMLTGHRPFMGSNAQDVFFAILKRAPPDLLVSNPQVPGPVALLVDRCLEKEPGLRFQSTRDLAHALELLQGASTTGIHPVAGPGKLTRFARAGRPYLVGAALALVVGGASAWVGLRGYSRQRMPSFHQVTFRRGTVYTARFTEGAGVVYSARWDGGERELFSTLPGTVDSLSLRRPDTDVQGRLASGEMLIVDRPGGGSFGPGTLARMPLGAGPAKELASDVTFADGHPGTGDLALIRSVNGKDHLEFPQGQVLYESPGTLSYPRISPKGDRVALLEYPSTSSEVGMLVTVDRKGRRTLVSGPWNSIEGLGWRSDGEIWFCASQTGVGLWLYATDFRRPPRLLCRVPGRLVLHDLSLDGKVLAERNSYRAFIYALPASGGTPRDLSWLDFPVLAQVSRDGRNLLFTESGDGGGADKVAYLRPMDGSPPLRLGEGRALCLSADGRKALLVSPGAGRPLVLEPVGPGSPVPVPPVSLGGFDWAAFLPGDQEALVMARAQDGPSRLHRLELATGKAVALATETFQPTAGGLAPDGRFLLGLDGGRPAILSLADATLRPLENLPPGLQPVAWQQDMKGLYLVRRKAPAALFAWPLKGGPARLVRDLPLVDPAGVLGLGQVSLSADGQSIAYQGYRLLSDLYVIEGLD